MAEYLLTLTEHYAERCNLRALSWAFSTLFVFVALQKCHASIQQLKFEAIK